MGSAGPQASTSPELQFTVNFTSTGTHYVWIRASADANTDDSIFAGIDGVAGNVASTLTQYGVWQWSNAPQTGTTAPECQRRSDRKSHSQFLDA